MKKTKLFLIDYNEKFLENINQELGKEESIEVVGTLSDGNNAIEIIDKLIDVDVLVINLLLPNFDGLALLKHLNEKATPIFKKSIVSSFFATSDIMNVLRELNVVYFIMYPYTAQNILDVINVFLPNSQKRESEMLRKIDHEITKLFVDIGIPANLKGYNYLKTAIIECVYNHHQIDFMTKELYPLIGLKYDCSGMSVERSMRTAVRVAVERGNEKTLDELFGHTISIYKDHPTNSEFISIIAEKLRLKLFDVQSVA